MKFDDSITIINGIGSIKAKLFEKLGIFTIRDLLYHFPKNYTDKSEIISISGVVPGNYCTVSANLIGNIIEIKSKRGILITKARISDGISSISVIWYNNKYIKNQIKQGERFIFFGKVIISNAELIMEAPEFEKANNNNSLNFLRIVPEYSLTEGLSQKELRKNIFYALEKIEDCTDDIFCDSFKNQYNIKDFKFCIKNIHFPENNRNLEIARYRFKFEELFILQFGLISLKSKDHKKEGIKFDCNITLDDIIKKLPYRLTKSQWDVFHDICSDMQKSIPMNRLIQGDVGCGKTIVAILSLFICVKNGYQGIIMVPTEVLALQHINTIKHLFEDYSIKIGVLKGSMSIKEKKNMLSLIETGDIDIIVGTHAILEENVNFKKLGLVITDEQHRFGVRQRAALFLKGSNPHMLVMTATPIPRTLSLLLYGDLDISIIKEKPTGRVNINTYLIDSSKKERMYNFIKKEIESRRQVYYICPLVDESEKLGLKSAIEIHYKLKEIFKDKYNIELLHGKMKSSDKDKIMSDFIEGKTDILVSTTVVEVGVNVPNATIMVIENADRFGLAQLHQLRGRVGRGEHKSYCILITDSNTRIANERLSYLCKTCDGFEISEMDLKLRGGGDIIGLRQHGISKFKLVDIFNDMDLIKLTREAINYFMKYENTTEFEIMKTNINDRFKILTENIVLN